VIWVGADLCFSHENKFHAWDSKYDAKLGQVMRVLDVFGNRVKTWPSYYGFKQWFEYLAKHAVPRPFINCTEGGILGAYPEGNIFEIKQIDLDDCLAIYRVKDDIVKQATDPKSTNRHMQA
jgi:hypothetical protein